MRGEEDGVVYSWSWIVEVRKGCKEDVMSGCGRRRRADRVNGGVRVGAVEEGWGTREAG